MCTVVCIKEPVRAEVPSLADVMIRYVLVFYDSGFRDELSGADESPRAVD